MTKRIPRFPIPITGTINDIVTIEGSDYRHIVKVLRLGVEDAVTLFGEDGIEFETVITSIGKKSLEALLVKELRVKRESVLRLTLYQAIAKGDKMDLVVEKATELGVTEIVPVITGRTEIKQTRRLPRWRKIATEASKQCGRTSPPEIKEPVDFDTALDMGRGSQVRIIFYERSDGSIKDLRLADAEEAAVIVGPEGGFTEEEARAAEIAGWSVCGLGPRILRTETAGITAVVLLQFMLGDL